MYYLSPVDLSRMYRALVRFEEGEARLVQMMEAFVDEVGSTALREVSHVAKTVSYFAFLFFTLCNKS